MRRLFGPLCIPLLMGACSYSKYEKYWSDDPGPAAEDSAGEGGHAGVRQGQAGTDERGIGGRRGPAEEPVGADISTGTTGEGGEGGARVGGEAGGSDGEASSGGRSLADGDSAAGSPGGTSASGPSAPGASSGGASADGSGISTESSGGARASWPGSPAGSSGSPLVGRPGTKDAGSIQANRDSADRDPTVAEEVTDCSNEVELRDGVITTFDDWDGNTTAANWVFTFNGAGSQAVSGGLEELGDGSGSYSLSFVPGPGGNGYAVSAVDERASNWGAGVSFWLHCVDASSFKALEFRVKGQSPTGTAVVRLLLESGGYDYEFNIPRQWQIVRIAFADLLNGTNHADGRGATAITFSATLKWGNSLADPTSYVAQPGAIEISVDDLRFVR